MYEDRTYEAIQEKILERVRSDVDKREGSIIWDAAGPVAYHLAQMYFELENYMDLIFQDTSVEDYLDRGCKAYGITRKPAVKAVRRVTAGGELEIGSRWQIQDASYIITARTAVGEYSAECEQAGSIGNRYYGDLQPVGASAVSAALGGVVMPGADQESDDSLRERLFNKIRRPSTSGNANDYYNWAMAYPGVGAAKVWPLADGPGTVRIIIADENKKAAPTALVAGVREHVEELRPVGATVSVVSAIEKSVNISARVRLTGVNLGAAQNAFEEAVSEYLQQSAFRAAYISLARVGNLLMSIPGVEDYTDLKLNGSAENVTINPDEVAVAGTVRMEVILNGSQ